MKTSIVDELNLPEDVIAVARREAMRSEKPISEVLKAWVMEKGRAIKANSLPSVEPSTAAA